MSDSEIREDLVAETARLRFSVSAQGLRDLLAERGHDAMKCVKLGCDQGDDVCVYLVLDDSSAVQLNYREHYRTRQAIRIVDWEPLDCDDRDVDIARDAVAKREESFAKLRQERATLVRPTRTSLQT